jgi:hypothetical protein
MYSTKCHIILRTSTSQNVVFLKYIKGLLQLTHRRVNIFFFVLRCLLCIAYVSSSQLRDLSSFLYISFASNSQKEKHFTIGYMSSSIRLPAIACHHHLK